VFSKNELDLGSTHFIKHHTDTRNDRPVAETLRRHPKAYFGLVGKEVDMLLADVIEPATSAWASNVGHD
jgi:hypothetical protein